MYEVRWSKRFKRDVRRCEKQKKDIAKFKSIHEKLVSGFSLPMKNRDHSLGGNWKNYRECHIEPDWLVIYRLQRKEKIIEYIRMGSHAELF